MESKATYLFLGWAMFPCPALMQHCCQRFTWSESNGGSFTVFVPAGCCQLCLNNSSFSAAFTEWAHSTQPLNFLCVCACVCARVCVCVCASHSKVRFPAPYEHWTRKRSSNQKQISGFAFHLIFPHFFWHIKEKVTVHSSG